MMVNKQEYEQIKRLLCPYCNIGLPDYRDVGLQMFIHTIPGTPHKFECAANKIRGKILLEPGVK